MTLMSVALLVGGCGNRTASTQDAAQKDTILAEEVPDTIQTLSQEPSGTLPDGAVKAAEANGLFVFTKLMQESSEDDPADIRSLWLYERKTGRVDSLFTTNPFAEQRWAEMSDGPVEVALTQIAAADKVCFTLILGAYRYHEEGGRYSVAKTYTLAGQFIKEEETEE